MPTRKPNKPPKHLWRETQLEPKEGRIIIFPFYLWHNVEPNQSNDIRISASFNFIQKGFENAFQ
jgi:ectoine hydroxylase-related dioxygenase (phytanoyl-CoA dioxygenase family)